MQQPLCHLYFLVVMEHLWSKHHSKVSDLTRNISYIQEELKSTTAKKEMVLIQVELQAVIQMLIQHLAVHLDPKGSYGISDYQAILEDLNK